MKVVNRGWDAWGVMDHNDAVSRPLSCSRDAEPAGVVLDAAQRMAMDKALAARGYSGDGDAQDKNGSNGADLKAEATTSPVSRRNRGGSRRGRGKRCEAKLGEQFSSKNCKEGKMKKGELISWGTRGRMLDDPVSPALDRNDPNYDSGAEENVSYYTSVIENSFTPPPMDAISEFKREASEIILQYLQTGDIEEVDDELRALESMDMHYIFVKRCITIALDHGAREKERISMLLSSIYGEILSPGEISHGFLEVLKSADDLLLDVPTCIDDISHFIARAAVDDVLPPAFIATAESAGLPEDAAGAEAIRRSKLLLDSKHRAERLQRCWGDGAHGDVTAMKRSIDSCIAEYLTCGDREEAIRCIRELRMPFFCHEVVKRLIMAVLEAADVSRVCTAVTSLLSACHDSGLISDTQLVKGFFRVSDRIDDIALDAPAARDRFGELVSSARQHGWLEDEEVSALNVALGAIAE